MLTPTLDTDHAPELLDALDAGLAPCAHPIDEARHTEAVERVTELYNRCLAERDDVPALYRPGGEWEAYIAERPALYDAMRTRDLSAAGDLLRRFWRNDLGLIVKEYASYPQLIERAQPRTDLFLERVPRNLAIWRALEQRLTDVLAIPPVGDPWGLMIDGVLIAPKATRYHSLAAQIAELVRTSEHPTVCEVGAGYCGAAHYLLRDHPQIRYTDFDLPETLVLGAYYLISSNPDARVTLHGETDDLPITPGATLLPNHTLPSFPTAGADVLVNTFSFSEMPMRTLAETLAQATRITRGFLLHHNMDRPGVKNRGSERIPASRFPIAKEDWRLLHTGFDRFHESAGDYREYLYQRIGGGAC